MTIVLGLAQLVLALIAWGDPAGRPEQLVRGRKEVWGAVIALAFVGPVLYLRQGRIFPRYP